MSRTIADVLHFRKDISPFLVHLTRNCSDKEFWLPQGTAKERLREIIRQKKLVQTTEWVSRVALVKNNPQLIPRPETYRYFSAVCFTETPLDQVQCLLNIEGRSVDLQPYGLVFLKEKLRQRHVSPVLYVNNAAGDAEAILKAFLEMCQTRPGAAEKIVPLVDFFGQTIDRNISQEGLAAELDFSWEREWRLPHCFGDSTFDTSDVFIGLCPENETDEFEHLFAEIFGELPNVSEGRLQFIDPQRPLQWYANKLIKARQRMDLPYSAV